MNEITRRELSQLTPLSTLELRFVPLDYVMHWHRCGLAADYFAAHVAYTFDNRGAARAVLATVINELLENVAKFSSDKSLPASLSFNHFGDWLAIETRNRTDARRAAALDALVRDFAAHSAEALFLARIASVSGSDTSPSGLGLLVLKKDYGVRLTIECQAAADGQFDVFVQALIHTEELEVQ
jgi:hypothetical protein